MNSFIANTYPLLRPLLFALPPEAAHSISLAALRFAHRFKLLGTPVIKSKPIEVMGLEFPNRLGVAAGLDKNGTSVDALGALGFGFVEVGTVTPRAQSGNPSPRLFRLHRDRALINRMGFPNDGVEALDKRLAKRRFRGVCGVNIGKNAGTALDESTNDYLESLEAVYSHADYVAINISSPNTSELRRLQYGERLQSLLTALNERRSALARENGRRAPLLVKLTVDLGDSELEGAARIAVDCGMDGLIVSNTTIKRDSLVDPQASEEGGLSGAPLFARALHAIALIRACLGRDFPLVGVGGIESAANAVAMRAAGADLIQIYTGLIYRGPRLIDEILNVQASV